jgi:hypothetical protein
MELYKYRVTGSIGGAGTVTRDGFFLARDYAEARDRTLTVALRRDADLRERTSYAYDVYEVYVAPVPERGKIGLWDCDEPIILGLGGAQLANLKLKIKN